MSDKISSAYSELINNQHDLADREAKFSAIFNSITDAIVFADCERHILQINAGLLNNLVITKRK